MPAQFGIIGNPLTHSFSPAYFTKKFTEIGIDAIYEAFPIPAIQGFKDLLLCRPGLKGLSVTIPYKQSVMPLLAEIDPVALAIGAVNCIAIKEGYTIGYNTDVLGFGRSLAPLLQSTVHTHALILGTGGAARAVAYALQQMGIVYKVVSRTVATFNGAPTRLYENLQDTDLETAKLIINTTPLGMYPDLATYPAINYKAIGNQHILYDLVYNPAETRFLKLGKEQGATIKNGYEMLVLQAEAAWEVWVA